MLRVEQVGVDDNFFELGGNSIQGAVLINRLQEKIGHHVSVIALFDSPTIAGLAHYLGEACPDVVRRVFGPESLSAEQAQMQDSRSGGAGASHRPKPTELLVAMQPEGSGTPWFMVHPPGGIVVCYQALIAAAGPGAALLRHPIARPARRARPARPAGGDGRRNTWPPSERSSRADLTSSGVGPPADWSPWRWPSSFWRKVSRSRCSPCSTQSPRRPMIRTGPTGRAMEYGLDLSLEELSRLGPDQQLPFLWQHALKLGLIESSVPMQFAHQVIDDLKRIFHHHMVLTDHYVVRPYPGRITLIRPSDAPFAVPTPHDRGWGSLAAEVDVHFVPGQHHSMVKEPHVQELARMLEACLLR